MTRRIPCPALQWLPRVGSAWFLRPDLGSEHWDSTPSSARDLHDDGTSPPSQQADAGEHGQGDAPGST